MTIIKQVQTTSAQFIKKNKILKDFADGFKTKEEKKQFINSHHNEVYVTLQRLQDFISGDIADAVLAALPDVQGIDELLNNIETAKKTIASAVNHVKIAQGDLTIAYGVAGALCVIMGRYGFKAHRFGDPKDFLDGYKAIMGDKLDIISKPTLLDIKNKPNQFASPEETQTTPKEDMAEPDMHKELSDKLEQDLLDQLKRSVINIANVESGGTLSEEAKKCILERVDSVVKDTLQTPGIIRRGDYARAYPTSAGGSFPQIRVLRGGFRDLFDKTVGGEPDLKSKKMRVVAVMPMRHVSDSINAAFQQTQENQPAKDTPMETQNTLSVIESFANWNKPRLEENNAALRLKSYKKLLSKINVEIKAIADHFNESVPAVGKYDGLVISDLRYVSGCDNPYSELFALQQTLNVVKNDTLSSKHDNTLSSKDIVVAQEEHISKHFMVEAEVQMRHLAYSLKSYRKQL